MAPSSEPRRVNAHAVLTDGRDQEKASRYRNDNRGPTRHSNSTERNLRKVGRRDRRSRSPSRQESSHRRSPDHETIKDREREYRTREAEEYKRSTSKRSDRESGSPLSERRAGSGSSEHTERPETRPHQDPRPIPNLDSADDRPGFQSAIGTPADVPIFEPKSGDTMSDPRSKLKEALTRFLSEASEQASLQLRKDSAKRALDRRVADYEKSRIIHDDYPPAAEAQGAAKEKARQEFEELDEELTRKHKGSVGLIELITDCVFSQTAMTPALVQSQALNEIQPSDLLYRESFKAFETQLESSRALVRTELASIRQDLTGCVDQIANLATDIEQLKRTNETVDLKTEIESLSSRLDSVPNFSIELGKETARIDGALGVQANDIENLLITNRNDRLEYDSLKSTVASLTKSEEEVKNVLTKVQVDLKNSVEANRTTTETRLDDISTRISTLESSRAETRAVSQRVEKFDDRVKRLEGNRQESRAVTEKLGTIDTRLGRIESGSLWDEFVTRKLDGFSGRVLRLEAGQESMDSTRQGLTSVEALVQVNTQSLEAINKRLKAVEDINKSFQSVDNGFTTRAEQSTISDLKKQLHSMQDGLRDEIRMTQEAGDEFVAKNLREIDDRVRALQDITALQYNNLGARINALEVEVRVRDEMAKEQKNITSRIESLERAYNASSTQARFELSRQAGDIKRLADAQQVVNSRSSNVPPQFAQEISRISGDIHTLRNDLGRLSTSTASIVLLTNRVLDSEGKINTLINDADGLKIGYTNLDYRMSNLTTAGLARQILEQLDAHRLSSEANITALSLRVQEFDGHFKNGGEMDAEAEDRITTTLRLELTNIISRTEERMETSIRNVNVAAQEVVAEVSKRLDAIQHKVDESNESFGSLREDVDSMKAALLETKDHMDTEISNSKAALIEAQEEISGAKAEFKDGLDRLKGNFEDFSAQLQMQVESRLPEKRKLEVTASPRKANGHGQATKKRKVSSKRDRSVDNDSDYRSAAS